MTINNIRSSVFLMYGEQAFYVYILTNKSYGIYYTGVTSDLVVRIYQHRNHIFKSSFSDKYNLDKLVWYEQYRDVNFAIKREKLIKRWRRAWKEKLIEDFNPNWLDLWEDITISRPYIPPPMEYYDKIMKEFQEKT